MNGIIDRPALIAAIAGLASAPLGVIALEAIVNAVGGGRASAANAQEIARPASTTIRRCGPIELDTAKTRIAHASYGLRLAAAEPRADDGSDACSDMARDIYVLNDALPADGVRGRLRR